MLETTVPSLSWQQSSSTARNFVWHRTKGSHVEVIACSFFFVRSLRNGCREATQPEPAAATVLQKGKGRGGRTRRDGRTRSMVYKGDLQITTITVLIKSALLWYVFGPRSARKPCPYWLSLIKVSLIKHIVCSACLRDRGRLGFMPGTVSWTLHINEYQI